MVNANLPHKCILSAEAWLQLILPQADLWMSKAVGSKVLLQPCTLVLVAEVHHCN